MSNADGQLKSEVRTGCPAIGMIWHVWPTINWGTTLSLTEGFWTMWSN